MSASSFFRSDRFRKTSVGVLAGIALSGAGYSGVASAAIVACGDACKVNIVVRLDGQAVDAGFQQFTVDTDPTNNIPDGQFALTPHIFLFGDWGSVTLSSLFGNAINPSVQFRGDSVNNTSKTMSVDFEFLVPISLKGPVIAESQLEYGGSGFISPLGGGGILLAYDLGTGDRVNKGVDIGRNCSASQTPNCGNFTKTGAPFGDGDTFSVMQVNVQYNTIGPSSSVDLHSSMRFNGQVIQHAVPEPSTYVFLIAGLTIIGLTARRRINS